MNDIKSLTQTYITAFHEKNMEQLQILFHEDFSLTDPAVHISGRDNCCLYIADIFSKNPYLSFQPVRLFFQDNTSIIEFILKLGKDTLAGVDIVEWENEKIKSLTAYLYQVHE